MKVLYLTNIPSPYKVQFLNELSKDCELDVLFTGFDKEKREDEWYKDNKYFFNFCNVNIWNIKQFLKNNYDIYINDNYASICGAYFIEYLYNHKKPFFINADGGIANKNDNFLGKSLKSFFISKGTYFLSSGKVTDNYFITYGASKDRIFRYCFTSLNKEDILNKPLTYSEKVTLRKKAGFDYKRVFISAGSLIERKGYDLFLRAINGLDLKDTIFLIAGSGEKEKDLKKYIENNTINNVMFLGFRSKEELFNLYKMSDIFFFPSREDIWGLVINEAMANGLPIISSDNVVASEELLDSKYLYNPNDIERLKELLLEMDSLSDKELYDIGNTNINTIKSYTIENMAKRYIDIFNEVIRNEK